MNDVLIMIHNTMNTLGISEFHIVGIPLAVLSVMAWNSYREQGKERTADTVNSNSEDKH